MKLARFLISTVIFLACSFGSFAQEGFQPMGDEAYQLLDHFLGYDKTLPFDTRIAGSVDMEFCVREKIVFTSMNNQRVPGYLALPKTGKKPYPMVMMLHGHGHTKESWWDGETYCHGTDLTQSLLESGYAVMMLDACYYGERMSSNDFEHPNAYMQKQWFHRMKGSFAQTVIDYRRALDYLETREEIDHSRIGMVGYSLGGMQTFTLTGLEARIKTCVTAVAPPLTDIMGGEIQPFGLQHHAVRVNDRPFLMLLGNQDELYTPEWGQELFQLINSSSKEIIWYDSGHSLPEAWTGEAFKWFNKYL